MGQRHGLMPLGDYLSPATKTWSSTAGNLDRFVLGLIKLYN